MAPNCPEFPAWMAPNCGPEFPVDTGGCGWMAPICPGWNAIYFRGILQACPRFWYAYSDWWITPHTKIAYFIEIPPGWRALYQTCGEQMFRLRFISRRLPSIVAFASLMAASVQAAAIVGDAGAVTGAGGLVASDRRLAASFLSPSVATQITSIDILLAVGSGVANVELNLFSDAAGLPGVNIGSLGTQAVPANGVYNYTPGAALGLAAATSYWLVINCPNCVSGTITTNWSTTNSIVVVGLAGAAVPAGSLFSNTSGSTWVATPQNYLFTVNGDVAGSGVPEPSTLSFAFASVLGLAVAHRRRVAAARLS